MEESLIVDYLNHLEEYSSVLCFLAALLLCSLTGRYLRSILKAIRLQRRFEAEGDVSGKPPRRTFADIFHREDLN